MCQRNVSFAPSPIDGLYIYWYVCVTTNNGAKSKGKNLPFWIKKATAEKKVLFDDDDSDDDDD